MIRCPIEARLDLQKFQVNVTVTCIIIDHDIPSLRYPRHKCLKSGKIAISARQQEIRFSKMSLKKRTCLIICHQIPILESIVAMMNHVPIRYTTTKGSTHVAHLHQHECLVQLCNTSVEEAIFILATKKLINM